VANENRAKAPAEDGFAMDKFNCVSCGYANDADENAARAIAMKGRWLKILPKTSERQWTDLPDALTHQSVI
jgi:transposase